MTSIKAKQTDAEALAAYEKHKAKLRENYKKYCETAPLVECECGFITKKYMLNSHMKSARHQKKLEDRKQMQAAAAASFDLRANSSISQGVKTEEAKI